MENKEKIDYLLVDIRELEKMVASMRDNEIYPVSFFSQSFSMIQKIVASLHSLEADQVILFRKQMEAHQAFLEETSAKARSWEVPATEATEPVVEKELTEEKAIITDITEEKTGTQEETGIQETPIMEETPIVEEEKRISETRQQPVITFDQTIPHTVSLNEILEKQILTDFRKAFSLNDRFRFRRELFGGDENKMNKAISDLNEILSYEESVAYLDKELKWNIENEAVADFLKLLEKRFS